MKYNKKTLLGVFVFIVIIFITLIVITRIESNKRKETEYNKLVDNLCSVAVDLAKSNENTIVLDKEKVDDYTFVSFETLSILTMGSKNPIPFKIENPILSNNSKPVFLSKSGAIKVGMNSEKKIICLGLVDLGEPPKITLKGKDEITLKLGQEYNEPGYTAKDKEDGDLTKKVLKSGFPDVNERGEYTIIYYLKDSMDNEVSEIRKIFVK